LTMEKRRVDDLIAYLDRLITLDANDYRTTREITNCLTEIQRELRIGPWDRTKTHNIAPGVHIAIDDGHGNVITIEGPASISVLPLGDRE
jgi:hypothetical protein